jgi:biopolymer transport protein ExbB/TolQ
MVMVMVMVMVMMMVIVMVVAMVTGHSLVREVHENMARFEHTRRSGGAVVDQRRNPSGGGDGDLRKYIYMLTQAHSHSNKHTRRH